MTGARLGESGEVGNVHSQCREAACDTGQAGQPQPSSLRSVYCGRLAKEVVASTSCFDRYPDDHREARWEDQNCLQPEHVLQFVRRD